jgi:hypothetical protein
MRAVHRHRAKVLRLPLVRSDRIQFRIVGPPARLSDLLQFALVHGWGVLRTRLGLECGRLVNGHDSDLGIVTPDRLAGSSGATYLDENENRGNVGCGF